MLDDSRVAIRALRRAPAFAIASVATLALTAGANAGILAVVHAILVKPLPYAAPDRLVAVWPGRFQSNADLLYLRDHTPMLSSLAAVAPGWTMALTGTGEPLRITVARVSGNFFQTLSAAPVLGSPFTEREARPGADAVVLSHRLWTQRFGADAAVLGRSIHLDALPFRVVAVLPRSFEVFGLTADAYTPFAMDPAAWYHQLSFSLFVGRLAPRVTVGQADRDYRAVIPEIRRARGYPADYGRTARIEGLREAAVGDVRSSLVAVAAAVALVLLIAGANVGTLQLTRSTSRGHDLAVRAALGASRGRLARALFAESALLALAGGALGLVLAVPALPLVVSLLPKNTPRLHEVALDPLVAGAVVFATMAIGLVMGIGPALAVMRLRADSLLRSARSSASPRATRTRAVLVGTEVAIAVVLTIGAGLMLQTLRNLRRIDPGFHAERVLALHVQPTGDRYRKVPVAELYERLLERVRGLPGVRSAGAIQHLPFTGYSWNAALDIEGFTPPTNESRPVAGLRIVTPGYFESIGQPLLRGRPLERRDAAGQTAVVVNDALARRYFGSAAAAVGRTVRIRGGGVQSPWMPIVGVVGDVRHTALTAPPVPEIYTSVGRTTIPAMMLAIRVDGDPGSLAAAVREAIWSVDRDIPLSDLEPMSAKISRSLGEPRLLLSLLGAFAALGVLLALIGVYGVVAYSVAHRRRELGIMIALGAERGRIVRIVLREGMLCAAAGLAAGVPAALLSGRLLRTLLHGVSPTDPATYIAIAVGIMGAAAAACALPAHRASRVDPAVALRQE